MVVAAPVVAVRSASTSAARSSSGAMGAGQVPIIRSGSPIR
jgi:hypothetical protein